MHKKNLKSETFGAKGRSAQQKNNSKTQTLALGINQVLVNYSNKPQSWRCKCKCSHTIVKEEKGL